MSFALLSKNKPCLWVWGHAVIYVTPQRAGIEVPIPILLLVDEVIE
jgi:hypothetical protein